MGELGTVTVRSAVAAPTAPGREQQRRERRSAPASPGPEDGGGPKGRRETGRVRLPVLENFRVAVQGLAANKLRAALTMLGMIIGVAAVIAMIALGEGAREKTLSQIRAMGTNLLLGEPERARIGAVRGAAGSWNRLKIKDLEAITPVSCPAVQSVSPEIQVQTQVKAGNQNLSTNAYGVWADWVTIRNYQLSRGRFFTEDEEKKRAKVVVLGADVYDQLFPDGDDPTGKLVRVNNVGLRCIGVMARKGQTGNFNPDDLVAVPAGTAYKRLFSWWMARPRSFCVTAVSEEAMDDAQQQVDALFRKRYRVKPGDPSTIKIRSQSEVASAEAQAQDTFTALLASIAGVSLLVGGIGIMNIMLVSVTERTREIGIRKAIGAKRRDILLQFLIEAVTLSVLGGLIGIAMGVTIALVLPHFLPDLATVLTVAPMLLSFGFSVAVGVFFGFYPAQKASKLDPIIALRYE